MAGYRDLPIAIRGRIMRMARKLPGGARTGYYTPWQRKKGHLKGIKGRYATAGGYRSHRIRAKGKISYKKYYR